MQDIRIDETGAHRCWKCGGRNFDHKRTFRSKASLGVGAVLTHKKLKCQDCGEYNDTGHAKPFDSALVVRPRTTPLGTLVRQQHAKKAEIMAARAAKKEEKEAKHHGAVTGPVVPPVDVSPSVASVADELKKLAELRDVGVLTEGEFAAQKAVLLGR